MLGAVAVALGAAAVPAMSGCKAVPYVVHTALSWCLPLLAQVLDEPVDSLPPSYALCGSPVWSVRDSEVKFCLYCSPNPADPVYVQLGCEGKFYPIRPRPPARPRGSATSSNDGVHLSKVDCDEFLLSVAQAQSDEFRRRADASIIVPNDRFLPSARLYRDLSVELDGVPTHPDGRTIADAGSALRLRGAFDDVARYAAELGVRSLEFRDGGDAWSVEFNPEFSAVAIFRNARLAETRFLLTPSR